MATGYLVDHEAFFNDLIIGDDSDAEFSGFESEDDDINNVDTVSPLLDSDNWADGDREPPVLPFMSTPGVKTELPESPTILDYFSLFVSDQEYEIIVRETNRYANQYLLAHPNLPPHSRFRKWEPVTVNEIQVYIALIIASGLVQQSDFQDYFSTNEVTAVPFFPSCMTRDRFLLITSFFHLSDNERAIARGAEGYNPMQKLGQFLDNTTSHFSSKYVPHENLSLDEGMVPWRGNLAFRVYSPDKPIKYGIKSYMLCDATNGYCSKIKFYTGKSNATPSEQGRTYDLVMEMLRGYFGQGYKLFCDNYYSSPQLFWDLYGLGVGATGTVRSSRRGMPDQIKQAVLAERGDTKTMSNGPLAVTKYKDHKDVYLLSTTETSLMVNTNKRNRATGDILQRPKIVTTYDKYMGGVDRTDQMVAYIHNTFRTLKWWKKVFLHLLGIAILNAYIIYKESEPHHISHRAFRRKLVQEMVEGKVRQPIAPGRPSARNLQRLTERHFISRIIGHGAKTNISRMCAVCSKALRGSSDGSLKRCGHESRYECKQCKVTLCIEPCFEIYHTKQDYVLAYKRWRSTLAGEE